MRKILTPILLLGVLGFLQFSSSAASVETTGAGKTTQTALIDALRNAVAQGAGVDVSSRTLVENFMLQHDRVMTASDGYVKNFSISSDTAAKDGIHTVAIVAEVESGRPGMSEVAALRMIYERVEQPRVLIVCNEKITGLPEYSSKTLQFLLTDMANSAGYGVVDMENFLSERDRVALIDKFLKNTSTAEVRLSDINKPFELIIVAELAGNVGAIEKNVGYEGVKGRNVTFTLNLKAVWRDTSENIAVLTCGPISGACANPALISSPDQMVTHYLKELINGSAKGLEKNDTVINFFEKIVCKWVNALDRGSNITLTFNDLDEKSLKKLTETGGLSDVKGVSNVRVRSFNPGLQSVIELNGTTNANDVKTEALRILGGSYTVHHMDRSSIEFQRSAGLVVGSPPAKLWIWLAVGGAVIFMFLVIVVVVVILIVKKKK